MLFRGHVPALSPSLAAPAQPPAAGSGLATPTPTLSGPTPGPLVEQGLAPGAISGSHSDQTRLLLPCLLGQRSDTGSGGHSHPVSREPLPEAPDIWSHRGFGRVDSRQPFVLLRQAGQPPALPNEEEPAWGCVPRRRRGWGRARLWCPGTLALFSCRRPYTWPSLGRCHPTRSHVQGYTVRGPRLRHQRLGLFLCLWRPQASSCCTCPTLGTGLSPKPAAWFQGWGLWECSPAGLGPTPTGAAEQRRPGCAGRPADPCAPETAMEGGRNLGAE